MGLARRIAALAAVGAAALLAGGCQGYQLGYRSLYRPDVHTVYVPIFESDSLRRNLGERLTEAVVKEIEKRTPYKVVSSANADSILTGRILFDTKRVLIENTNDEPRAIEVNFAVQISWLDRRGALIGQQSTLPLPSLLVDIGQTADLVPEGGQSVTTAHQETIEQLAAQIVSQMEMPW